MGQIVPDGLGDDVARVADSAVVQFVMRFGELGADLRVLRRRRILWHAPRGRQGVPEDAKHHSPGQGYD
jgi:hypothetical protein